MCSGRRPGEKLFEELLVDGHSSPTAHSKIMRSLDTVRQKTEIDAALAALKSAVEISDLPLAYDTLRNLVEGYVRNSPDSRATVLS